MQLLVLLLMLLTAGKGADPCQIKPIIESIGGSDAAQALEKAEELSAMISAVQSLSRKPEHTESVHTECGGFPLAPIASIADERITYALSRYIAADIN